MPVEGSLPQTGEQHDINADADRCFRARCPKNWRPHSLEGTDDYGLDYQVQTTPDQQAKDIFRVQLKGTRSPDVSAGDSFISLQLKASTIRFYDRIVEPVLLVVCDLSANLDPVDCPLYYAWLRDELRRIDVANLPQEQKYVTLRVLKSNRLRATDDLSDQINAQNELSRAGQALGLIVEASHPGIQVEERLGIVQGMARGVAARSAAFIDQLAAPADDHWINPAPGSLPWHLNQAKSFLRTTNLFRAGNHLRDAQAMLAGATPLETADYWFLVGKLETATGADSEASSSFRKAHMAAASGKYLAAWAEAEIRARHGENGPKPYPDLLAGLQGDDPHVLSARSRVLAAEGREDEAVTTAYKIAGSERHSALALVHTMFSRHADAITECEAGLALPNLPDNSRQLLLLLRARAKFNAALAASPAWADELLPPSGVSGLDADKFKEAWEAILECVESLREAGWGSNIDHLADIWGATASALGKQKEVLPALAEAARARPHLENLQTTLETLAAQCGEFAQALAANDRLPDSQMRSMRRTLLLHEAGQHGECVRWFGSRFDELDRSHKMFGPAVTVAAVSAQKLVRPELVQKCAAALEADASLTEHSALLSYYLSLEANKLGKNEALSRLLARYDELGQPFSLGIALLQEFDPTSPQQAPRLLEVSAKVSQKIEPSSEMAIHMGLAMVTTTRWQGLLDLCRRTKRRLDANPRMLAFEALALDRLGDTAAARTLLEQMLSGGVVDSLALNTYVNIMIRCGYVDVALGTAEKILESATTKKQRMDCLRLLFSLVQTHDVASSRLLALATQMGALVDQTSEVEEGIYLCMFLTATLGEANIPSPADRDDFGRRVEAFLASFPNSRILRRGQIEDGMLPAQVLAQLKALAGFTDEGEAFRTRIVNQLQQGTTIVPFGWRPRLILLNVHDVFHLWEIAKVSRIDDNKHHLVMLSNAEWTPEPASKLRERTPLLDITALLVILDLGLIDAAIGFFGKIAIAASTLETVAKLLHPMSGSPVRTRCTALQDALKPHLASILQPSVLELADEDKEDERDDGEASDRDAAIGREQKEISRLCREQKDRYRLYSDDVAFRFLCSGGDKPDGFCTLDLLSALCETGALSPRQRAGNIARLCSWRVGVTVRFEDLIALLPTALNSVGSLKQGLDALDADTEFTAVISSLWDFRGKFEGTLQHASAVLRRLADETTLSDCALASIIGQWFVKAGMKTDAPPKALHVLTKVVVRAALFPSLPKTSAKKLWAVYRLLVEFHHGDYMDEAKEREAIQALAAECAGLQLASRPAGEMAFAGLRAALTAETGDETAFSSSYSTVLVRLTTKGAKPPAGN